MAVRLIMPETLSARAVHIWRINVVIPTELVQSGLRLLSLEEKQRADRFHFERHRTRFVAHTLR